MIRGYAIRTFDCIKTYVNDLCYNKIVNFSKKIIINASAEKVWDVLGRDFANIGKWSTAVAHSSANNDLPRVNNSPIGGRTCNTTFGNVSEEFTAYDDNKKTLSFKGVIESKIFSKLISTNEVKSIDENTSEVIITPHVDLTFIGKLISPMVKMQLSKTLDQVLDDLKYYVENGKPSPAKLASQQK